MHKAMTSILWWGGLVAAPLVLAGMELFHPAGFTNAPGMYAYLCTAQPFAPQHWALAYFGPHWWFTLHVIQLPLLGLVSVGLWLAMDGIETGAAAVFAWLSRIATFFFLIGYTALDSIGGVGLGRTMLNMEALNAAGKLDARQMEGAALLLDTNWVDPWIGGVGSVASLLGSWAVFASALCAAVALLLVRRAPWPALVLLVGFGWEIQVSHASPHGPLGFALLAVAATWIRLAGASRAPAIAPAAVAA
ncbi:hypothetical protein EZH22_17730 [Xanthobacter dioxanivorans]|uniref:Uncharacterized protein n=1 Tax=Xanthobacter dioxanivorans TaxID=2528964 RepID=A0A974PKN5_9HYPH|nr:hypothetical protein [Xanthobacter dioxanivorans]QRG04966.1 hypothetical protein EZH22_17730 [Xanthobacter dioxanivorans]